MKWIVSIMIFSLAALAYSCAVVQGDVKEGEIEIKLKIEGMTDDASAAKVKEALEAVEGVSEVKVKLQKAKAKVHAKKGIDPKKLIEAVEKAGFKAELKEKEEEEGSY